MKPMFTRSLGGTVPPAPRAEPAITYGMATAEAAAHRNSLRVALIRSTIVNSIVLNLIVPVWDLTAIL
jgi:hypothetical protein